VAQSPDTVQQLTKKGFKVIVESGAGVDASFSDEKYKAAGATVSSAKKEVFGADLLVKVRAPQQDEFDLLKEGGSLISFIYPGQNKDLLDSLAKKKMTVMGMDCVPRITRAQVFDALSSMSNIAGYKAVVEAAHHFGRFFAGQMTAAGRLPPAKVLIIGGGVAGLSAIATARNLGAIVRCFDTRPAVKEQVESLGGEFLELGPPFKLEEGAGGYAKEMTKEFIEAEHNLFAQQCKEVDIVVTTALIPGKPAPKLILKEHVDGMKEGSVIVDLAAEAGGNVETTKPNEIYSYRGIVHIGVADLPSRLSQQSSSLYANNVTKLLMSMINKEGQLQYDLGDDVVRGTTILRDGNLLWPPPKPPGPPPQATKPKVAAVEKAPEDPYQTTLSTALLTTGGTGSMVALGMLSSDPAFSTMMSTFALAGAAGYQVVWGVVPALHTPLMSVTNAISGMTAVGGLMLLGQGGGAIAQLLAATAILASTINIAGGFLVTQRMLDMFKRPTDPPEYNYLYAAPGLALAGGYLLANAAGFPSMEQMTYLAASLCCIGSIGGLASQKSARYGNALGIMGVSGGVLATLGMMNFPAATLATAAGLMGVGGAAGVAVGQRVQVTELPQTVAAFHSLVGFAAMTTSIASFIIHPDGTAVHKIGSILGDFIGGVTLTGSLVAFAKLHGIMPSKPLALPNKNLINIAAAAAQAGGIAAFMASASFPLNVSLLTATAALSMGLGYHLVASVGGADMPVCITVLNSYSGWALVAEGFMLNNPLLTIVGSLIGFSGGILSYIMFVIIMNQTDS